MPPTLALGLWSSDRKGEAVEWFAAAVRTEPTQWLMPPEPITATRSPLNNTKGSAADTDNKVARILTTIMGRVPFNSTW